MYQPCKPCGAHDALLPGFECANTFVPGGANGVLLKSNSPNR